MKIRMVEGLPFVNVSLVQGDKTLELDQLLLERLEVGKL